MSGVKAFQVRQPSRTGRDAVRSLRASSRVLERALSDLELDWPPAIELLEHAAELVGDAVVRRGRALPVLATVIGQPVSAYAGNPEGAELDRFLVMVRRLAELCVAEMGGVVLVARNGDEWRLGTEPLLPWYWARPRRPDQMRVRERALRSAERGRLQREVLFLITSRNSAAFDGHIRDLIPELADGGQGA